MIQSKQNALRKVVEITPRVYKKNDNNIILSISVNSGRIFASISKIYY